MVGFDAEHPYFQEGKNIDGEQLRYIRKVKYCQNRPSLSLRSLLHEETDTLFLIKVVNGNMKKNGVL